MAAEDPAAGAAKGAGAVTEEAAELRPSSSFEYRSRLRIGALPLVHIVRGIDPSTGARPPAIGVVAVGQVALGVVAVGQLAVGGIALGQAAIGLGWGIGQLACGLIAAGQVAAGALGSLGQVALGAHPLGLVQDHAPWAAIAWIAAGVAVGIAMLRRRARLGPLVGRGTGALASLASVRDGAARVAARVVSENRLRAPLSNRPCVFWHGVRVGPGVRVLESGGGEIAIADDSGSARVDLSGAVTFIRNDTYSELPAPDWSLYMETFLTQGDSLYVAGPAHLEPDAGAQAAYRPGGVSPVFRGQPNAPLVVTTQSPDQIAAELRLGFGLAAAFVCAGLLFACGHAATLATLAAFSCGCYRRWG
jgi:hypothetical protein